jgi:hypothetical protein
MKKMRFAPHGAAPIAALVITAACAFMLTGCSNVLTEKPTSGATIPAGFGTVRISLTQGAARTAMPTATLDDFASIEYLFARDGAAAAAKTPVEGVFTLEPGNYTLTVKAYITLEAAPALAAQGTSAAFTVAAGQDAGQLTVAMSPIVSEGAGALSFTLSYPDGVAVQSLTLTRLGGGDPIDLTLGSVSGASSLTGAKDAVASGYYILALVLAKAGCADVAVREAVHIYQNLTTELSYTFADAEFVPVPDTMTVAELYF